MSRMHLEYYNCTADPEYLKFDLNVTIVDGQNLVDIDCFIYKKAENVMVILLF